MTVSLKLDYKQYIMYMYIPGSHSKMNDTSFDNPVRETERSSLFGVLFDDVHITRNGMCRGHTPGLYLSTENCVI